MKAAHQVSQAWAAGAAVHTEWVCLYESLDQPAVTCPWSGSLTTFAQALSGSLHIFNSFLDGLWRTARWQFYFIFVTALCSLSLSGFFSRAWFYKSTWQCSQWGLLFQLLYWCSKSESQTCQDFRPSKK